ncbi:MAG: GIY-YIG nuclease family protein [Planctomycetes bacterium]|nr:GIY-YIG nuclease family protein [Planctomycetota bacterium]
MDFSLNKGIYCLIIRLFQEQKIPIGKLGTYHFPTGFYVYIGSAQNNLNHRIERHLSKTKNNRWHIDYLLHYGKITTICSYAGGKSLECMMGRKVGALEGAILPVKGFGSSDCSCDSHLYFFRNNPGNAIVSLKSKFAMPECKHYNANRKHSERKAKEV